MTSARSAYDEKKRLVAICLWNRAGGRGGVPRQYKHLVWAALDGATVPQLENIQQNCGPFVSKNELFAYLGECGITPLRDAVAVVLGQRLTLRAHDAGGCRTVIEPFSHFEREAALDSVAPARDERGAPEGSSSEDGGASSDGGLTEEDSSRAGGASSDGLPSSSDED